MVLTYYICRLRPVKENGDEVRVLDGPDREYDDFKYDQKKQFARSGVFDINKGNFNNSIVEMVKN